MFRTSVALNMSTAADFLVKFIKSGFRLCRLTRTSKRLRTEFRKR